MVAYADTSLAIGTTVFAAFVLVWKIAGADFIPGFEQIFGLVNDDAQYPRRRADAAFWQLVYLCMYGGLGLVGCGAGLYISLHKAQHGLAVVGNGALLWCTRIFAGFHLMIAIHHILWGFYKGTYGQLDVHEFDVPWLHECFAVGGAWVGWHALKLATVTHVTPQHLIVRRKAVIDAVSILTLISLFYCLPANWAGFRDAHCERLAWLVTGYSIPIFLIWDAVKNGV